MMSTLIKRIVADRRGALIAEFAAALPVLVLLLLAGVEVSRFALLQQKLDRLATSMGDLVAQAESLTGPELDQLFLASEHITWPFDVETQGVVIISSIGMPSGGAPGSTIINWQRKGGGSLAATSELGAPSQAATLPTGLQVGQNQTIIAAEVFFDFKPLFVSAIVPGARLYHRAFFRPRLGSLTALN